MPSPNVTVASGATRRRKPPTRTVSSATVPTALKPSPASPNTAKTLRSTSKLRKPTTAGQDMRSTSPLRSPRPPPPPGIAPTGRSNARPARQQVRSPNAHSAPTIRKSPLAQMREEYDELKRKNNEYVKKIASQEEELKRLKSQLLRKTKTGLPPAAAAEAAVVEIDKNDVHSKVLQAKEKLIQEQDEELRKLRQQLEEYLRVQTSYGDELTEKEEVKKELFLVQKLGMEEEMATNELVVTTQESDKLPQLQSEEKGVEHDTSENAKTLGLAEQLEAQRLAHAECRKKYEAELAEKDKLLLERGKALDNLKIARDEAMHHMTIELLELKQQHEKEMKRVLERLNKVESPEIVEDTAKLVDIELHRILEEFEQEDYTSPRRKEPVDNVRPQEVRHVERSRSAHQFKTHQANWSSRFLPTEAISWPAPPPLSILKKTAGPKKKTPAERIANAAIVDYAPVLTPLDPKAVQVYISTVSGNAQVKYRQEQIQQLLRTHNVKYELVDVASSVSAFQYMKRANNDGSSEGRAKELPQIFVGGEYRGQLEEVLQSIEDGNLDNMLRPAAERDWTPEERAALQRAEASPSTALPPPVRVLPSGPVVLPTLRKTSTSSPGPVRPFCDTEDEDEAILRELEREIVAGKTTAVEIADL
ncbi:hypothetical protein BX666DRAFT_1877726 [Dichotomocladium elegans]|nr:hypothetical protein BX666DRAFT_1877726 [Dichotomocladium elegans]